MTNRDIKNAISSANNEIIKANKEFEYQKRRVQNMTSTNINLSRGDALSRVNEIVTTMGNACEDKYTSMQVQLKLLNDACNSIPENDIETMVLIEVVEMMKLLNQESGITVDYASSFQGVSLGDLAVINYSAPMESIALQKYWEAKLNSRSDYASEKKNYEKAKAIEEKKKKGEENSRSLKIISSYLVGIEKKLRKNIEEISATKQQKLEQVDIEYNEKEKSIKEKIQGLKTANDNMIMELETLSIFKFGLKKRLKNQIEENEQELIVLEGELKSIPQKREDEKKKIIDNCTNSVKNAEGSLKTIKELKNGTGVKDINLYAKLIEILNGSGYMTLNEILDELGHSVSNQNASSVLRELTELGLVNRKTEKRMAYFGLIY